MPAKPTRDVDAIDTDIDASPATPDDTQSAIPAFRFPFKPAEFAAARQPNYPGAGKSTHDKTPSRAPNGTRRSMGKR